MLYKDLKDEISKLNLDDLINLKENMDKFISEAKERDKPMHFTSESDIGSVLVGSGVFKLLISNYQGDGINDIWIFKNEQSFRDKFKDWNTSWLKQIYSLGGIFTIYNYDCAKLNDQDSMLITLNGQYDVYVLSRDFQQPQICFVQVIRFI